MKSRGTVGLALTLVVLLVVGVLPSQAADRQEEAVPQGIRLEIQSDGGGVLPPIGPNDPGVENLNGDPEDWLGGQNVRKGVQAPTASEPALPPALQLQIQRLWQMFLIATTLKTSRQ